MVKRQGLGLHVEGRRTLRTAARRRQLAPAGEAQARTGQQALLYPQPAQKEGSGKSFWGPRVPPLSSYLPKDEKPSTTRQVGTCGRLSHLTADQLSKVSEGTSQWRPNPQGQHPPLLKSEGTLSPPAAQMSSLE